MKESLLIAMTLLALAAGCSSGDKNLEEAAAEASRKVGDIVENPPTNISEAIDQVEAALAGDNPALSAASLRTLLPEQLAGLDRVSYEAERAGVGIKVSKARAEYGDGDERLSLMITDLGSASGLARMGMELFAIEVDKQNEKGFEKTTTYRGHKTFQRMHRSGDQSIGEIMVFVADRFTVQLDGQNVPFDKMTEAMDAVDIDALLEMRDAATSGG